MVGERIRQVRQGQQLSLADVAGKAKISVATLSRIETDKQSLDLGLFLILVRILKTSPHELLGDEHESSGKIDPLAVRIASLATEERANLWREMTAELKSRRARPRSTRIHTIAQEVEELLAQIEFMHEELEAVRVRIRKRR